MDGFEVAPPAVRAAGKAAAALAQGVRGVELVGPCSLIGGGLPGGEAAVAADRLGAVWSFAVAILAASIARQAEALSASGSAYGRTEQDVTTGFGG